MENLKSILLKIILPIVAVIVLGVGALFVLDSEETKVPNGNDTNIVEDENNIVVEDKEEVTEEKDEIESEKTKESEEVVSDGTVTVIGGNNSYWKPTYGNGNTSNNVNNNSNKVEDTDKEDETNKNESEDKVEDTDKEDETNKDESEDKVEDTDKEDETNKDESEDKVEDTDKEDETNKDESVDKDEESDKEDETNKDESEDKVEDTDKEDETNKDEEITYVEPTAEFSVNGITSSKEASTKITASGDYTKVEYGISTTEEETDVEEWVEYVEDTEISIPNDKGNVYVIVRLTYEKDNTFVYVVSDVYEMIAWETPTATFTLDGNTTEAASHVTSINVTGDYESIEYAIANSQNEADVTTWTTYTNNSEINIYSTNVSDLYVIVKIVDKNNDIIYVKSNVFKMTTGTLIDITKLVQAGGYDIVNDIDTVTYTFTIENNLTPNVTAVNYTFWTDDTSIPEVTGSYDMTSSTIEIKDVEDTGVSKVYIRFTLTFDDASTTNITYEKDV